MIVEKGHFHFAEKYWGDQGLPGPPLFRRPCKAHLRVVVKPVLSNKAILNRGQLIKRSSDISR